MAERLYNEYLAAKGKHVDVIDRITLQAVKEVMDYADKNDLCLRDTKQVMIDFVDVLFAEEILSKAMKKRKAEKVKQSDNSVILDSVTGA